MMVVIATTALRPEGSMDFGADRPLAGWRTGPHQVRRAPVVSSSPLWRQRGSLSIVRAVMPLRFRITVPYRPDAVLESLPPGGSSMNGMNLSGKPGIGPRVQM